MPENSSEVASTVMSGLEGIGMPIAFCGWRYLAPIQKWELVIGTAWWDTKGKQDANRALQDVVRKPDVSKVVGTTKILLVSPKNPNIGPLQKC